MVVNILEDSSDSLRLGTQSESLISTPPASISIVKIKIDRLNYIYCSNVITARECDCNHCQCAFEVVEAFHEKSYQA
jgi:hypothetical protein